MWGIVAAAAIITFYGLFFLLGLAMYGLAKHDIFFTTVAEGTYKAVTVNGQFRKMLMSRWGWRFKVTGDQWIPVLRGPWERFFRRIILLPFPSFLRGIRWIGIYPFARIYSYKFVWNSIEEVVGADGKTLTKRLVQKSEIIDYLYARRDGYGTKLEAAECADNIPLDSILLVFGTIHDPRLALFGVEKWLEATLNMVTSRMREFFGERTYDVLKRVSHNDKNAQESINQYFAQTKADIKKDFGFEVDSIEIVTIDPATELAQDFIRATTQVYVAEQKAKAISSEADGETDRVKRLYGAIAGIANGRDMWKWEQIAKSGLTTYVEGGSGKNKAVVAVPAASPSTPTSNQGGQP